MVLAGVLVDCAIFVGDLLHVDAQTPDIVIAMTEYMSFIIS